MAATEFINNSLFNDASCVAYYRLENVNDSKGSFNLTNVGTVAFNPALFNNGGDFGSANSTKALEVDNNLGIDGGNITISMWFKVTGEAVNNGAAEYFTCQSSNPTRTSFTIEYTQASGIFTLDFVRSEIGVSAERQSNTVSSLVDSTFHHYALTYDGTNIKGYVDGVFKGQQASSGNGNNASSVSRFGLGRFKAVDAFVGGYASGIADDVVVFTRALTLTEIQSIALGTSGGGATPRQRTLVGIGQ